MDDVLSRLSDIIQSRRNSAPEESYVAGLFQKGEDSILKKLGEEAAETIIAAKNNNRQELVHETADLWFHCIVLLGYHGVDVTDVLLELESRFGQSGVEEKRNRKE